MSKGAELKKLMDEANQIRNQMDQLFAEGHYLEFKSLSSEDLSEYHRLAGIHYDFGDKMREVIKRKSN